MAKKEIKEKSIEVALWESANKLRGSVESAEYKHVVLGLIFLKFASDKFEEHRKKLIADGKEKYIEMPDFYNMSNVFFLEEISRWSYIVKKARQNVKWMMQSRRSLQWMLARKSPHSCLRKKLTLHAHTATKPATS